MIFQSFRHVLWLLVAVCALVDGWQAAAHAADWQPYREPVAADGALSTAMGLTNAVAGASESIAPQRLPVVQAAQAICDPTVACGPAISCDPALVCPQPLFTAPAYDGQYYVAPTGVASTSPEFWQWRLLPEGVVWKSYLAGVHEPRISGVPYVDQHGDAMLDVTLGGRASLLRYGTEGPGRPMGAELQVEGAAFPRLNLDEDFDMDAADFRFGLPLVYGRERWEAKFSYYHLSSHMGDEFAIREMALAQRINYSRDCLVAALAFYPLPAWRWYAEAAWAFRAVDGAEPWEFQFGVDVATPGPTDYWGSPFVAINGHIRQDVDFGGNVVFQAGWMWRGNTSRTLRAGFHYYNGKNNQFQFFNTFEEQIGGGVWYDF